MRPFFAALAAVVSLVVFSTAGHAANIKVLSSSIMKPVLPDIVAAFETATGHKVAVEYGLGSELKIRLLDGEETDVALITAPLVADLVKQEKIVANSQVNIAHCGLAVVVRAGTKKPDISSPEAFKRSLLDARSIAFSRSGQSGLHLSRLLEWLGIADEVKRKIKPAAGNAAALVAKGEAEIGIQQYPDARSVSGVDIVGELPEAFQNVTVFSVGMQPQSKQSAVAEAFMRFLASPVAVRVLQANGFATGERSAGS